LKSGSIANLLKTFENLEISFMPFKIFNTKF